MDFLGLPFLDYELAKLLPTAASDILVLTLMAPLWGCATAQTWKYYKTCRGDRIAYKYFIAFCLIAHTGQLISIIYDVNYRLIQCRLPKNFVFLFEVKSILPGFIIHYVLQLLLQCVYAMRVWHFSEKRISLLVIIVGLALVTFVLGIYCLIYVAIHGSLILLVYDKLVRIASAVSFGSNVLCNIVTCGSMTYFLRSRSEGTFRSTRSAVGRLIFHAINIGFFSCLFASAAQITYLIENKRHFSFVWFIFFQSSVGVYINSLLLALNARKDIGAKFDQAGHLRQSASIFDIDAQLSLPNIED